MSPELKQRLFYQKLLLIQDFDYRIENGKRNWVSVLLSSEINYMSIGQGFGKLSGVPLNILSSVFISILSLG